MQTFPIAKRLGRIAALAGMSAAASLAWSTAAQAYVGPSFLQIPGVSGNWKGAEHRGWVKAEAAYWVKEVNPFGFFRRGALYYSGPAGPKEGGGKLVVAFNKTDPMARKLMGMCAKKQSFAEMTYSEDAELNRRPMEIGPRPASVPAFFNYRLGDVRIADCPVAEGAPQQAFVLEFKSSKLLNYEGEGAPVVFPTPTVQQLTPLGQQVPGRSKAFVMTWFAAAHDVADDQCPVMNKKPTEADYYALMTPDAVEKEKVENAKKGGVNYENGQMGYRGPGKLDVTRLPGIVADPGNARPATTLARGFDLHDEGAKRVRRNAQWVSYNSADGRAGIDNGLYTAQGCIQSFQGHKGFILQFSNNQMHDGMMSMLVEIAGIDNDSNDDNVQVRLSYSLDDMAKSGDGKVILADYSFRLTDKPEYAYYATTFPAKIVDGVIVSDKLDEMALNLGQYGTPNELRLWNARIRLEIKPDGNLQGVLGGYMDWRPLISRYLTSTVENIHGFQVPGLFNALRRYADGLPDPVTGELNGISSAYDIEGVPIFLGQAGPQQSIAAAGTTPGRGVAAAASK